MHGYQETFTIKRLWLILGTGMVFMFGILLLLGAQIYQQAPPMPENVKSASGEVLVTRADIETGQNVWQSIGGMEQGSIWGHGSYLAPDWSADWLHREAETLLASMKLKTPSGLDQAQRDAVAAAALKAEMRRNSYDPVSGDITVSDARADAIRSVEAHFVSLYEGDSPQSLALRRDYGVGCGDGYGGATGSQSAQLSRVTIGKATTPPHCMPDNWPERSISQSI